MPAKPHPQKKRLVLTLLAFGCVLVDLALLGTVVDGLRWVIASVSPFALVGFTAVAILAARTFFFVRSGIHSAREEMRQVAARS